MYTREKCGKYMVIFGAPGLLGYLVHAHAIDTRLFFPLLCGLGMKLGQTNQLYDINWGALDHASHASQLMSCIYYVCACACVHVCIHACMHACVYMCQCVCVHVCMSHCCFRCIS